MYEALYGVGGAIIIRELVGMIKPIYSGKSYEGALNVVLSMIIGVLMMIPLAYITGRTWEDGLYYGLLAGILSPVWNTAREMAKG